MPSTSSSITKTLVPRFQSAVRKLQQNGVDALKPAMIVTESNPALIERRLWRKPDISKRKAAILRKQAIIDKTYGDFDATTGSGWDSKWDIELESTKKHGMGRIRVSTPKLTKRFRTREERATKIEMKMEGMAERIEEIYVARQNAKPQKSFELTYKEMMKVKKK